MELLVGHATHEHKAAENPDGTGVYGRWYRQQPTNSVEYVQWKIQEPKTGKNGQFRMTKKSKGGRMTEPKRHIAERHGGKGMVGNRPAGRNTMDIW